ncbi:hypothetical protein BKA56DRAFT_648477 [Ilyonectria sp. MPI-CAGE-AT-0026]|nr:hypothetical protein BKA56DRAFT_648477 [Ilyonectria sp. MPI-CAGE-AT-0026]
MGATEQEETLRRFVGAMEVVYGAFEDLTEEVAENWSPLENLGAGGHRGRYLWTDAFGVCLVLAKRLVQTPLNGGLRIGKLSASESDGDGQYHYLTLWMFALNRVSLATDDPKFNYLAVQLAKSIHPRFVFRGPSGDMKMVWKISMDTRSVLVASEGHLDAATGFVGREESLLNQEIDDYSLIMSCECKLTPSGDTLDLGMGLWMCHFFRDEPWAASFGDKALRMARRILGEDSGIMLRDASRLLMFREFGACMGISCFGGDEYLEPKVAALVKFWEKHLEQPAK